MSDRSILIYQQVLQHYLNPGFLGMKASERKGWLHLLQLARDNEHEFRQVSLIRAYSWVEHALSASGLPRERRPVSMLLYQAYEQGLLSTAPTIESIRRAINTRHLAAHMDTVPPSEECVEAVNVLHETWKCLRTSYVTLSNSAKIARRISSKEGILSVSIYGSIARGGSMPNDIDLLVLDDGRFSSKINPLDHKYLDTSRLTRICLGLLDLYSFPLADAVNCRWLDAIIIDGTRFGKDLEYTQTLVEYQPDPYFFLNIAQDIQEYDPHSGHFINTGIGVLLRLREIARTLKEMGFLSDRRTRAERIYH